MNSIKQLYEEYKSSLQVVIALLSYVPIQFTTLLRLQVAVSMGPTAKAPLAYQILPPT